MENENGNYEQKKEKRPVMLGGERYSAEPIIEKNIGDLWIWLGQATKKIGEKRVTLPMRFERGKLLKEVKEIRKNAELGSTEREIHREKFVEHRKTEEEFVNQKDLEVETEWGKLEAKYAILNERAEGKPLIIIPGASNGMESVDSFVRRLAERSPDRKIIVLGYPDAPSGKVTNEFYEAVKNDERFGPHSKFFEQAIDELYPDGEFDILGYSAGGGIVQEMEIPGRVDDMVLINPFGSKKMSSVELKFGFGFEQLSLLSKFKDLARYVYVDDKTKDEQKRLKFATWIELGNKNNNDYFENNFGEKKINGKLVVVSGTADKITKSAEIFCSGNLGRLRKKQPNIEVSLIEGSPHAGPYIEPDKYIDEMERLLG